MKQTSTLIGAGFAAVAASSCCILPVVLGAASAGTLGFSAALTPYRPYFIGLTVLLLGIAFYFTYRPSKVACDVDGQCATEKTAGTARFGKAILWGVTVLTIGTMTYPMIAESRATATASATAANETQAVALTTNQSDATTKTAVFAVGNMTCASCVPHVVDALKKMPGVQEAKVDFKTKRATVRYDGTRVDAAKLRAAIESAGYPATTTT